jgi:hypothetical protein
MRGITEYLKGIVSDSLAGAGCSIHHDDAPARLGDTHHFCKGQVGVLQVVEGVPSDAAFDARVRQGQAAHVSDGKCYVVE